MYRLGIIAVGAFFQPVEGFSFVSPPLKSGAPLHLFSFHPVTSLSRRPRGEFVSLTLTGIRPLDHFNAFLCFRSV